MTFLQFGFGYHIVLGKKGEHLLKQCIRKTKRSCTTVIKFVILYNTKKFPITAQSKTTF